MDELLKPLRAWYQTLKPRERILALSCAAFVGVAAIYLVALRPLSNQVAKREARIERKQQDLAWMRGVSGALRQLAATQQGVNTGESLVVLIDRTARAANLPSALTSPNGDRGMRVRLENAPFDNIVLWLGQLQQQHRIDVEAASFDPSGKPGVVNVNLVLSRATQ